jgi:hypothetical protein
VQVVYLHLNHTGRGAPQVANLRLRDAASLLRR